MLICVDSYPVLSAQLAFMFSKAGAGSSGAPGMALDKVVGAHCLIVSFSVLSTSGFPLEAELHARSKT